MALESFLLNLHSQIGWAPVWSTDCFAKSMMRWESRQQIVERF